MMLSRFILPIVVASVVAVFISSALLGCGSARKVMYNAYEKVGVEKRDLLKKRIVNTRDEQKEAGESFGDALTRLRAVYDVKGGELAKRYDKLKDAYDDAEEEAEDVRKSIASVETVAGDLFKEWDKEADEISTAELRAKSRERLTTTKRQYEEMHKSLKASEARMKPVLTAFKDQVLYMKHNLNAQAISSLKGESLTIEKDITQLIERMNQSIKDADVFISQLP